VEIQLDRRFLFGFVAFLVLLIALGLGVLVGQLLGPPAPSPVGAQPVPQTQPLAVQQRALPGQQAAPGAGGVRLTEQDATGLIAGEVIRDPCFVVNLLEFEKNVVKADYRVIKASPPGGGPRLVVEGLNARCGTAFDFGTLSPTEVAQQTFRIKNEGDQDLVVTQLYTSCGCTVAEVEGHAVDTEGVLDPPVVLAPGESVAFTVSLDAARMEGSREPRIVQIFSNDPRGVDFPGRGKELRFAVLAQVSPVDSGQ
jgi:hypothetical protein